MADVKGKHPGWFKMKIERRELVRQLSPETAVNVLLACWDFLETGEKPGALSPIENVAFASFIPDLEEAWNSYVQRINAKKASKESVDIDRYRMTSVETEEETDSILLRNIDRERANKSPHSRFVPPTVDEVQAYCLERNNGIDANLFVDFYEARGWMVGKGKMKSWKAAVRTWEKRNAAAAPAADKPEDNGLELVTVEGGRREWRVKE